MHAETFSVPVEVIRRLVEAPALNVAVGTTSVRTMESLYWLGVKTRTLPHRSSGLNLSQWEAYDLPDGIDLRESYTALLDYATGRGLTSLEGATSLIIVPGYQFRVFDGLITNFHQPRSTLLMLVAAFTGSPIARIYQYALEHQFRFLSYGDSSLLWRNTP